MQCSSLDECTFFRVYGHDKGFEKAASGFILLYCKGERQDKCLRKEVGKRLGGPSRVPANMLPNGLPLSGTDDSSWSDEVREAAGRRRA